MIQQHAGGCASEGSTGRSSQDRAPLLGVGHGDDLTEQTLIVIEKGRIRQYALPREPQHLGRVCVDDGIDIGSATIDLEVEPDLGRSPRRNPGTVQRNLHHVGPGKAARHSPCRGHETVPRINPSREIPLAILDKACSSYP